MPWDWRYYSEKVRKAKYDFDEAKLQPYLELDNMIRAAFDSASRLFGLQFKERPDLPRYHPEVADLGGARQERARTSAFSSAIISRAPRSARARGCRRFRSQHKLGKAQAPDHRQRDELREGRGGRAGIAVVR